ncbi:Dps family protein [Flavimaricola marinus]|uniref:DNA protection during starvation protein n=1 Tax=Flavimaricola marinus TaxID=1819565 RepID=A0A238LMZ5_9RHOB|nr:DNA starvation/stationary phase protection protein [Flavimaricola marinus]SMY10286.1 DNA protection during starvation protein [Flavimaricola marinus]
MTDALKVVARTDDVNSGVRDVEPIAAGLADVLADTYCLLFKTHSYHWNVEGPLFYAIHNLTEEQYEDMFKAADELAERIRALGQFAPMSMSEIVKRSVIEDTPTTPSAGDMCRYLAADHERLAHRLHALIDVAGELKDPVTGDLATQRSAFHEKAAWMLRALVKT